MRVLAAALVASEDARGVPRFLLQADQTSGKRSESSRSP